MKKQLNTFLSILSIFSISVFFSCNKSEINPLENQNLEKINNFTQVLAKSFLSQGVNNGFYTESKNHLDKNLNFQENLLNAVIKENSISGFDTRKFIDLQKNSQKVYLSEELKKTNSDYINNPVYAESIDPNVVIDGCTPALTTYVLNFKNNIYSYGENDIDLALNDLNIEKNIILS